MGEVIVVTSGKGGVGKTTTTANLGSALALAGKKVALVDTDIGLRNFMLGKKSMDVGHILENVIYLFRSIVAYVLSSEYYIHPLGDRSNRKSALVDIKNTGR